jgi:hypothetical protein
VRLSEHFGNSKGGICLKILGPIADPVVPLATEVKDAKVERT